MRQPRKASQFREIICKPILEHISRSIFAEGLCSRTQFYSHFHIMKTPSLDQEKPGEFPVCSAFSLSLHWLAPGGRGDIYHLGIWTEKICPQPHSQGVRDLCVVGTVEEVGGTADAQSWVHSQCGWQSLS